MKVLIEQVQTMSISTFYNFPYGFCLQLAYDEMPV